MQYEDMKFSLRKMVYVYYIITETKSIIMYESLNIVKSPYCNSTANS